jgi:hypothetical protein
MKHFLPMILISFLAGVAVGQQQPLILPAHLQKLAVPATGPIDNPALPLKPYTGPPESRATVEQVIGSTRYDLQTNTSCQNRFYLFPDGTMGATWTLGLNDGNGYQDRGTGYNYHNGAGWGAIPTTRIESIRTGWPSYAPWNSTGEVVVSHHFATYPLLILTRTQKGSGNWTETEIPVPAGASGIDWPRMITSGPGNMYIHMIGLTTPVGNGGAIYEGLDGAIVYYRSLDGGATWDIAGEILPDLTSGDYYGFSADDYAWATPDGDTIAFVLGGHWTDTFIMKSDDNGITWTKIPILNNGNKQVPPNNETAIFACCDGSVAVEKDQNGVFHVVFGRMFAKGDLDGRKYFPWTDGLIYWNSTMPMLDDSLNADTLLAHGQLLGYVVESPGGDTIISFPYYGVSMSSYPQISIDESGRIFVIWSGLTAGFISPDNQNYRHIWSRASLDYGQNWGEMVDLNGSFIYIGREFVFPSMAKNTTTDNIHFIYQSADIPGSSIKETTIPVHDNTIEYRMEPKETIIGIEKKQVSSKPVVAQNFPNPARDYTHVDVTVETPADLSLYVTDLVGHRVFTLDKGHVAPGAYRFQIDAGGFRPGIYFYTVVTGDHKTSRKMIVE